MRRWGWGSLVLTIGGSVLVWAVLAAASLCVGSSGDLGWPGRQVYEIRSEWVYMASLVGAALAAAGVVYQAILRNPLADPYLLGISSGASLFAYLWRFPVVAGVLGVLSTSSGRALSQQAFAFAGAMVAVAVVFTLASSRGRLEPITLLLVGVIVNAVNGSIFLLISELAKDLPNSGGPMTFLVGRIQTNLTPAQEWAAAWVIGVGWAVLLYLSGELSVAVLGTAEAEALGVRIQRLRWIGLIVASLVTASAVAISGPIGFVGLVCPHLARLMVGTDHRKVFPVATGLGAGLLAVADAGSRFMARETMAGTWPAVGVVTGLVGGPFFLALLWRTRLSGIEE